MSYNLCDIIRFKMVKGLNSNRKGSIAYQYLTEQGPPYSANGTYTYCKVDFECLKSIVERRCTQNIRGDTFAIHVRAFDAINSVPTVDKFIEIIKKYDIHTRFTKCLLVYGNHKPHISHDRTNTYLVKLKNKIEELSLTCELSSNSVDEDFVNLATAKCYVAGYRGFGWLAACINSNEVIWDIQEPPIFPWTGGKHVRALVEGYEFYKNNQS